MATFFRTKVVKGVGLTPVDVVNTISNNRFTILGCNAANVTDDNVIVDVKVVDASSTEAFWVKSIVIPPYNSLKIVTNGEKLILAENCALRLVSDQPGSVDVVVSYAEIV